MKNQLIKLFLLYFQVSVKFNGQMSISNWVSFSYFLQFIERLRLVRNSKLCIATKPQYPQSLKLEVHHPKSTFCNLIVSINGKERNKKSFPLNSVQLLFLPCYKSFLINNVCLKTTSVCWEMCTQNIFLDFPFNHSMN